MSSEFGESVRSALIGFLAPLQEAAHDPRAMIEWLGTLGQTEAIAADPALLQVAQQAAALVDKLSALDTSDLESWAGISGLLDIGAEASDIQAALRQFAADPGRVQVAGALAEEVMALLLASYLRRRHPIFFSIASLLTLIQPRESSPPDPALIENDTTLRYARLLDRFKFGSLNGLMSDPGQTLADMYLPHDMSAGVDAWSAAALLYPRLSFLAGALGLSWHMAYRPVVAPSLRSSGEEPEEGFTTRFDPGTGDEATPPAPPIPDAYFAAHFPTFRLTLARSESGPEAEAAIELLASSVQHPGAVPGYLLRAVGSFDAAVSSERWRMTLSATGQIPAFVLTRAAFSIAPDELPGGGGAVKLLLERLAPGGSSAPDFVFGSAAGTRLELGAVSFEGGLLHDPSRTAATLSLSASKSAFVIAPGDGDGFVREVLPAEGVKAGFDLGLAWSSDRGLSFDGAAGLEADLPVGVSIGGVATVPMLHLSVKASDAGVQAEVSAAVGVSLGPVSALIDSIGFSGVLTFPNDGGNLGPANITLDFKPPSRIGLSVEAGPVDGSGFLAFDPERGEYAGELHLQFEKIAVRAIGLLTTRLPGGKPGFSLLVIVSTEFTPVQLGLGFMLVGVGGLLGINRTVAVEALRAGLKTGALGAVLSPPDPKANIGQLVATLAGLFPPAAGRHVLAPTARIVWGSPTQITIELCLVLELPSPVRLVALGRLRAVLPDEREAVVRIQVDVLGVIDFDRGEAAVDATLVDSRLAQFALTGDMALRMSWGAQPSFLLAVGGFHPRFAAPPGFPALARVAVALASGDNPKLRLEAYLALTSNTVQFGARVDLAARAGSFSVAGFLSFDALVTLAPLAFVVDIAAKLAVKAGGHTILSVSLALTLSGPRPWRACGRASFSILFFDISFGFDVTIGDDAPPVLPAPVDVAPLLLAAFADARAWSAQLPPAGAALVTLRALEPGTAVLAHPLARLQVRQRVAPLERTLDRFGTSVPSGATRFRITLATIGGVPTTLTGLQDHFAPAQFTALSDDAKLSAPSFEQMTSGAALGADGYVTGAAVTVNVVYEQSLVTAQGVAEPRPQRVAIPGDVFVTLTAPRPERRPAFAMRGVA